MGYIRSTTPSRPACEKRNGSLTHFFTHCGTCSKTSLYADRSIQEYTKSEIFPLKFCGTRWVENKKVAERAAKMMPSLKVYVSAVRDQIDTKMKATNPGFRRSFVSVASSKAFAVVQKYVNDPLVESKLAFFTCAADSIEPFLRTFQSEQPLAPFLHGEPVERSSGQNI